MFEPLNSKLLATYQNCFHFETERSVVRLCLSDACNVERE